MRIFFTLLILLFGTTSLLAQTETPKAITANGVELTYIERGSGPAVILLHGGQADYRAWDYAMGYLSKKYRVISYSRRYNYPNKNPIAGNRYSAYVEADDLAAFIDALKLKRVSPCRDVDRCVHGFDLRGPETGEGYHPINRRTEHTRMGEGH